MRYDIALLYAAIACELLLGEFCKDRQRKNGVPEKEMKEKLKATRLQYLPQLAKSLGAPETLDVSSVHALFDKRNELAHGNKLLVSGDEAQDAIHLVRKVQDVLGF
ncbi:MAG: hypothetical protein EXR49_03610 [Dehalococcoidia bacterium]|nr:hypothetical protein [Dehalococcoidia bacterium]